MSQSFLTDPPGVPIFGWGDDSFGVYGWSIGYWAVIIDDTPYTDLVTSEHADKPKFMQMLATVTQPFVDQQATSASFVESYDLDVAVGAQLDVCGLWIGLSRIIKIPLTGTYFSLDVLGLGLDEANWYVTGNATFSSVTLDDDAYRRLLKAKALANRWDGSAAGAYDVLAVYFSGLPNYCIIHDYQNMTMAIEVVGPAPDIPTQAILNQDLLGLRPEGVIYFNVIITP